MSISTAIQPSAVARALGIKTEFQDLRGSQAKFLPQQLAVIGQGSSFVTYSTDKYTVTSAPEAGERYGYGSPIHLAVSQLLPTNGDGVGTIPITIYPLKDATSSTPSISHFEVVGSPTGTTVHRINVSGVMSEQFLITATDTPQTIYEKASQAITAVLEMPVHAIYSSAPAAPDAVVIGSKWQGKSADGIKLSIEGLADGLTFTFNKITDGLINPSVDSALAQFGSKWESMVLNCLDIQDTVALDAIQSHGEGRYGALVHKPYVCFTGNTEAVAQDAITISNTRSLDRINSQLVNPGGEQLPFVSAARQLARIAVRANTDPAHDYGSQRVTGITPGTDGQQWDYIKRDLAVKGGSSTIEVKDGVVHISDVVTFYKKTGEEPPAYRYVVDIVKLQSILFNLALIFNQPKYDGAPLIPDEQPTTNRNAVKPKTVRVTLANFADQLGLEAIISDPVYTRENTVVEIDSVNPKRINVCLPVKLSGNTNIKSVDLKFGFYFGQSEVL